MTIPTLITNNQEKGWQTSASTFEAKFGQALKVMNTQNTLAGLNTTENFVAELQRHMKIVKTCDNTKLTDCFSNTILMNNESIDVSTISKAKHFGQKEWETKVLGLQFANGVSGLVAYNPKCSANPFDNDSVKVVGDKNNISFVSDCVAIVYDTQAFKNPNEIGKDQRKSSAVLNIKGKSCFIELEGVCYSAPIPNTPMTFAECTGTNATPTGEAFPAGKEALALGIKECYYENDYWAGAVKSCNGIENMISDASLYPLASYLYYPTVIKGTQEGISFQSSRGAELGFRNPDFFVWTSAPLKNGTNAFLATFRWGAFWDSSSNFYGIPRYDNNSAIYAICIGD